MKKGLLLVGILVAMGLTLWITSAEKDPSPLPDLHLPPGPQPTRVHGVVLEGDGSPVEGAVVAGRLLDARVVHRAESLATRADGGFELLLSPARGRWGITAATPDGRTWSAAEPVLASPDRSVRVDLRGSTRARPTREDSPNIAGEVSDRDGRSLSGIPIVVYSPDLTPIARTVTKHDGSFAILVAAEAPLRIGVEGSESEPEHIFKLPCLDLSFILPGEEMKLGRIRIGVRLTEYSDAVTGEILFVSSVGNRAYQQQIPGESGVYEINDFEYDVYDIFVTVGKLAGRVEGFDFRPDSDGVTVTVGHSATLRGTTDRLTRLRLRAVSPTYVPICLEWRQNDAARGQARNVIARSNGSEGEFEFGSLAPGRYELTAYGAGIVTKKFAVELEAGEEKDLGDLDLEPATADVLIRVFDQKDDPQQLEFGYQVTLYSFGGPSFQTRFLPGHNPEAVFVGVSPGQYYLRAERMLGGPGHTQSVGSDRPVLVPEEGVKTVTVDQTWRLN